MVGQQQRPFAHNRERWFLSAILLFAVLIRLVIAFYYGNWLPAAQDDHSYSELGWRLANGYGFSFGQNWYPFTPADTPTAHWSFLYTAFVGGIYALAGYQPFIVRLVQAVISGLFLPWLTFRFSRRLFPQDRHLPLLAAGLSAAYAYFILYAARLMTESFYILALLGSLEQALALKQNLAAEVGDGRPGAKMWPAALGLGVTLGIAALLRQSVLPWVAILFLWLLWNVVTAVHSNRQRLVRAVPLFMAALVTLAFILPFTIRNHRVYGEWLLLNSNTGYAMYSAQHPLHGTDFQAFAAAPLPEDIPIYSLNEAQWDRELLQRGIEFVLVDPGRYLLLSASRVLDYFEFWPTETTALHNAGRLLSFTLYLPFFITGIWLALRRARQEAQSGWGFWRRPVALVLLFILFYSLLHIFTWAMPRYRLPVDAVAIPFAALALAELYAFVRQRHFILAGAQKRS